MPYFTNAMAQGIRSSGSESRPNSNKQIRTMPGNGINGHTTIFREIDPTLKQMYRYEVTQRKLLFMRSLIRAQVNQLVTGCSPYTVEQAKKVFAEYQINREKPLNDTNHGNLFEASNPNKKDINLMVNIHSRKEMDPQTSIYLKVLNHLGRKHPYIIYTTDIFCDNDNVYIFQEMINHGNMLQYLEKTPNTTEQQAQFWARQLYRALDFLGDQAIAHRFISPKHLLMKQLGHEVWIKLTGFKRSIIYWDVNYNDVIFCSCFPVEQQAIDGPNFQSPEVYGNPTTEEYDPIMADIWSYGATVYYMLGRQYPYNMMINNQDIESEIAHNIEQVSGLSQIGKNFLNSLLRANANDRVPFDFIARDPWIANLTTISPDKIMETPFKKLEKIKTGAKNTSMTSSQGGGGSSLAKKSESPKRSMSKGGSVTVDNSVMPSSAVKSNKSGKSNVKKIMVQSKMKSKVKTKVKVKSKSMRI